MNRLLWKICFLVCLAPLVCAAEETRSIRELRVSPQRLKLEGKDARYQLLVAATMSDGSVQDVTAECRYQVAGDVVIASRRGVIVSRKDGRGTISVSVAGSSRHVEVPVEVVQSRQRPPIHFQHDIEPLLSKFGCNTSGCHGKAEGQNGFKLSVFGFDPRSDFEAITMESRGRRVFPGAPDKSLLLRKVSGFTPHGGGVRLEADRPEYRLLRDWIASGCEYGPDNVPQVQTIELQPSERTMSAGQRQQLRVIASLTNGRQVDVTALSNYQSNTESIATVDGSGLVSALGHPGAVSVMASYMGRMATFTAMVPRKGKLQEPVKWASKNFIDGPINRRLQQLNIQPSGSASDADFLRRVYLDVIGTLPTAKEARAFFEDKRGDRRRRLVEQLLKRPEFADFWALKWADLLRVEERTLGRKQAYEYYRWIRDSLADNKRLDVFAREVITANGPLRDVAAGNFYRVAKSPKDMASTLSHVFLGVRIECAQCHHHPFDRWSQQDYYGMVSYFTQVKFKTTARGDVVYTAGGSKTKHPRTGNQVFAHALGQSMPDSESADDRRRELADWMTSPENPWFARNLANRVWAHFMGRGLVEPVDDVRMTNPPSNPELLDALARHLSEKRFDLHSLIRAITSSAAYQRSSQPNPTNQQDQQNYSRYPLKQLSAEVLLDAVCQTTGVPEKFRGIPAGSRAIQLWDSSVPHYFLRLFGRPTRATACECDRVSEPTVGQVLHVLNSPNIHNKLSHADGRVSRLVAAHAKTGDLVDSLYLTFFSRQPTAEERSFAIQYIDKKAERQAAAEDVAWSMLNSLEFVFNH